MKRPTLEELDETVRNVAECLLVYPNKMGKGHTDVIYFASSKDELTCHLRLFSSDVGIICRESGTDGRRNKLFKYSEYSCLVDIVQDAIAYGHTTSKPKFVTWSASQPPIMHACSGANQITYRMVRGTIYC
jgi:hypothetical protein